MLLLLLLLLLKPSLKTLVTLLLYVSIAKLIMSRTLKQISSRICLKPRNDKSSLFTSWFITKTSNKLPLLLVCETPVHLFVKKPPPPFLVTRAVSFLPGKDAQEAGSRSHISAPNPPLGAPTHCVGWKYFLKKIVLPSLRSFHVDKPARHTIRVLWFLFLTICQIRS